MASERLSTRIKKAGLTPELARTFWDGVRQVLETPNAQRSPEAKEATQRLLASLPTPGLAAAPFEALWPQRELFLTVCVTLAVSDGEYAVEQARIVSGMAHRLGLSARQLAEIERRTIEQIVQRGAAVRRADLAGRAADVPEPGRMLHGEVEATEETERTEPVTGIGEGKR